MSLRRGPGQDKYLDSMEDIFAAADDEQRAMPHLWAVHDAGSGALVGFVMISDNIPQPMDEDLVGPYSCGSCSSTSRFRAGGVRRRDPGRGRELPSDAAWRRCALHQLRGRPGLAAWVLPSVRLQRHGRVMWGENVLELDLTP